MKKQFQSLTEKGRWLLTTLTLLFTLSIGQMWGENVTVDLALAKNTDPSPSIGAIIGTNYSKSNFDGTGYKIGSDNNSIGWDISASGKTFTAVTFNGYINTTNTSKNWGFKFSTDGGTTWGSELTQANDGTKSYHDISVTVAIPSGANAIQIIRKAGTSTYVSSITLTLASTATYTVTYLPGAGSGPEYIIDDDATQVADCPAAFSKSGYDFAGWKDGDDNDVAVGATVTGDMTLTAQWVEHVAKYTVKYMDGTTELGSETVNVGSTPAGLASDPTKDCYTFAAWSPALSSVSGSDGDEVEVSATWTPVYSSSATLISDAVVSGKPNVNTVFAASNIVSSITFTSGNYEFTSNETKPGYYGYKDKASGDYMKILVKQGRRAHVLFGNLGADPTITVNGVAKSLDAARTTGDMAENTFTWTASAEDALISITMGSGTNTLKKVDVIQLYTATRVDGKSDGAGSDANVLETTLPTPTAVSGWTFTGWTANEDVKAGKDTKTAGTVLAAGTYTLLANTTFTAQWAEATVTYDITYVSAHGTAPADDNAASVVLAELSEDGWAHKGWTANVDVTVDAATVEAGTLIANGKTAILASDVTFTAVWKEIFTVTFDAKGGSAVDPIDVEDGASIAAAPADPTKDDYIFLGWSETDGGDVVADITAITISDDKTFYAKWKLDVQVSEIVFSNSFKGWIVGSTVTVFYMAGESAPTIASYAGKNLKAEGGVVISGDKIIATATDDSELEFDLTMTEVTPLATTGAQTFDGTEGYIKTRHAWTSDKKWKMSKYAEDGRVARGETSMYIFLGAAESVTFNWGKQQKTNDVAVYVNGTFVKNLGSGNNSAVELTNGNNMVAFYSLQTSGDVWLNGLTVAPWVPVTAVTLKEGEDEISAKEIWETTNFTLTAEVTPDNASNKTITWTSSNDAVATVVNGVVTGVAASADPVTITASTVDGVTATCEVTVTAAPTPSADPVITTQPASANYYEGATIAALEVVATGESLTYQWYLGSDAIDGATDASYTPEVSAIGTYVYHCVVTNTEVGNLPTSLASDNATITIADDPAAIKLIVAGAINTTNFTTGVTMDEDPITIATVDYDCASFGSTGGSIVGLTGLNKVVAYNATKTQTKVKFVLYNTNNADKQLYLQKVLEGATEAVTETIAVPSKEYFETQYYEYNSSDLRSFYVTVNSTNIKILQVKVIENGTVLKRAGEAGYELNLNQGRVFGAQNVATNFEGLAFAPSSNAKVLNSTELPITTPLSFTIATPLTLTVETSAAKYYVSQNASEDGTTATAVTSAGEEEFNLTAGTWYIVPSTSSAVKLTNIAFAAPKCELPTVVDMENIGLCASDAFMALTVSASVTDGGTLHYQWYKHPAEGDDEEVGTDAASYTPEADGQYYVIVTNKLADHTDNAKKSNLVTVQHFAAAAITTAPEDQRKEAGQNATLTVEATGKAPLTYQWYTCDENGDNAVAIDGAEAATYEVEVSAGMNQYYKVVVGSGCGEASAVALVQEWSDYELADVTGSMTWNWKVSENAVWDGVGNIDIASTMVMANAGHGVMPNNSNFRSDMLKAVVGSVQTRVRPGQDGGCFQGSEIMFHTTVPGSVTVTYRGTGNDADVTLTIGSETLPTYHGSFTTSKKVFVPAGDVVISSGSDAMRVQKIVFNATPDQIRTLTVGNLGTVCWPNPSVAVGAEFYEMVGKEPQYGKIVFDQLAEYETLEAGKAYLMRATEATINFYYVGDAVDEPSDESAFQGVFVQTVFAAGAESAGLYFIKERAFWAAEKTGMTIPANRAYLKMYDVQPVSSPSPAPGRRRIVMDVQGTNISTGIDALNASEAPVKMIIDGQLFILRCEKIYNAKGQLVK